MLTEADHELRRTGLTGTDAAAIVGESEWMTPSDVWVNKKHPEARNFKKTPAMDAGEKLEPYIASLYANDTGFSLYKVPSFRSAKYPFVVGSPDFLVEGLPRGVEIKFALEWSRSHWGPAGGDEIPPGYLCQCYHYMTLCDYKVWDCAVLIGGWDFRVYHLFHDDEFAQMLLKTEEEFYERYIAGDGIPPVDYGGTLRNYIRHRWPRNDPTRTIRVGPFDNELVQELLNLRQGRMEFFAAEKKKESAEHAVQLLMQDATALHWPEQGLKITWKNNRDTSETDWEGVARHLLSTMPKEQCAAIVTVHTAAKKGPRVFKVHDTFEE